MRFVMSTLAVAALWAAPAVAAELDACYEELDYCIERANQEPVDWNYCSLCLQTSEGSRARPRPAP